MGFGAIASISFAAPLLLWLVSWIVDSGSNSGNYIWLLIGLSLLVLGIIIWGLFRQVRLRIDRRTISMTNELLGFKWQAKPPAAISDTYRLELRYNLDRGIRKSKLSIVTKHGQYKLHGGHGLNVEELFWLAAELSNKLQIKIN